MSEVYCENCDVEIEDNLDSNFCQECFEHLYCECGNRLEDSYGSPGDGFCVLCR